MKLNNLNNKYLLFNVMKYNVKDDDDDDYDDDSDYDYYDDDEQKLRKQQLKEKVEQYEEICKIKEDYYNNIIRKSKNNFDF